MTLRQVFLRVLPFSLVSITAPVLRTHFHINAFRIKKINAPKTGNILIKPFSTWGGQSFV